MIKNVSISEQNAVTASEKNDPPHQLRLALCLVKGDVLHSSCSCVAGKVGFCNHISALTLKICKITLFEAKTTKDLCEEKDENPELPCTSQLQRWYKKGGGENIIPQPVMEVAVKKTKLDERSSSGAKSGVKCLLYEARQKPQYDPVKENLFKTEISKIDSNMGFTQMSESVTASAELVTTKFGKTPVGSFLSCQTFLTESNFVATADLTSVPRNNVNATTGSVHYPRFPFNNEADMVMPQQLDDAE